MSTNGWDPDTPLGEMLSKNALVFALPFTLPFALPFALPSGVPCVHRHEMISAQLGRRCAAVESSHSRFDLPPSTATVPPVGRERARRRASVSLFFFYSDLLGQPNAHPHFVVLPSTAVLSFQSLKVSKISAHIPPSRCVMTPTFCISMLPVCLLVSMLFGT